MVSVAGLLITRDPPSAPGVQEFIEGLDFVNSTDHERTSGRESHALGRESTRYSPYVRNRPGIWIHIKKYVACTGIAKGTADQCPVWGEYKVAGCSDILTEIHSRDDGPSKCVNSYQLRT